MIRNLLLISNSTLHGSGYLDHCEDDIRKFLKKNSNVLFIPYARPSGISHIEYTKIAYKRLSFQDRFLSILIFQHNGKSLFSLI